MATIREELMEATSLKKKKNEDDTDFIKRLSAAVDDLEDDAWKELSTEAQEFHNSVVKAKDNEEDPPSFPDEEDADAPDEDEDSEEESAEEETAGDADKDGEEDMEEKTTAKSAAKAKGKTKAAKEKEKPAGKAAKAPAKSAKKASGKGNGEHKVSMCRRLKQILIKKPTLGVDDLIEKLTGEGYKPSKLTVGTIRSDTRDTMKLLKGAGLLEIDLG